MEKSNFSRQYRPFRPRSNLIGDKFVLADGRNERGWKYPWRRTKKKRDSPIVLVYPKREFTSLRDLRQACVRSTLQFAWAIMIITSRPDFFSFRRSVTQIFIFFDELINQAVGNSIYAERTYSKFYSGHIDGIRGKKKKKTFHVLRPNFPSSLLPRVILRPSSSSGRREGKEKKKKFARVHFFGSCNVDQLCGRVVYLYNDVGVWSYFWT